MPNENWGLVSLGLQIRYNGGPRQENVEKCEKWSREQTGS